MKPSNPNAPRRPKAQLSPEALESRSMMTGGMGNTFAILPVTIDKPGGTAQVQVKIDPAHFTLPKGRFAVGINFTPTSTSKADPVISAVSQNPGGRVSLVHAANSKAVIAQTTVVPAANGTETLTVTVKARKGTSGNVLVGFYLPGDANGDGVVDQADVQAIGAALGSKSTDTRYSTDADSARIGRVTRKDLTLARQNLGASVSILPVVSADLDPATNTGAPARTTTTSVAHFTGGATPGATLTFSETTPAVVNVSTTAGADGKYSITVPLGVGSNTFHVSISDPFGQTIAGDLSPLTYTPPIALTTATKPAATK